MINKSGLLMDIKVDKIINLFGVYTSVNAFRKLLN